jgi:hypothetical protein
MNKKIYTSLSIALLTFSIAIAQVQVNKKVLLTLQPNETILTGESCIDIAITTNSLYVVTLQNGRIFVYENGQRKGPFSSPDAAKVKNCNNYSSAECAIYKSENSSETANEFLGYSEDGKMHIKFKGKTYGPYKFIRDFFVSKDKSVFTAVAANDDLKFTLISSDNTIQPIKANVSKLLVSSSGKKFLAIEKQGDEIDPNIMNIDYSKLTTDQIMKMAKEMEDKKKNAGEPQAFLYTNGGKKFGPYPVESISDYNPAFNRTGGDNWYMLLDNALYINGIKIKQFDIIHPSTCNIWISADGKRYVVTDYEKMYFSDGSKYNAPIKITTENKDGKTLLKWVAFENGKEIVSYSREL